MTTRLSNPEEVADCESGASIANRKDSLRSQRSLDDLVFADEVRESWTAIAPIEARMRRRVVVASFLEGRALVMLRSQYVHECNPTSGKSIPTASPWSNIWNTAAET